MVYQGSSTAKTDTIGNYWNRFCYITHLNLSYSTQPITLKERMVLLCLLSSMISWALKMKMVSKHRTLSQLYRGLLRKGTK